VISAPEESACAAFARSEEIVSNQAKPRSGSISRRRRMTKAAHLRRAQSKEHRAKIKELRAKSVEKRAKRLAY